MSTEKYYNMNSNCSSAQNVQKVRFMPYAKRYKKFTNLLRGNTSYPLRWNVSNSVVLQKTQDKVVGLPAHIVNSSTIIRLKMAHLEINS